MAAAETLRSLAEAFGQVTIAESPESANVALHPWPEWAAFVLEENLPAGSGLSWLARERAARPFVPALVIGQVREASINAAFDLGASFVALPLVPHRVSAFLRIATSLPSRIAQTAESWRLRCRLSIAEADILRRAAIGENTTVIGLARGTSILTVKKQVVGLLQKTADDSLALAANRLIREAAQVSSAANVPVRTR
jgi:DNA-binding NarL/FixJ family response regulator